MESGGGLGLSPLSEATRTGQERRCKSYVEFATRKPPQNDELEDELNIITEPGLQGQKAVAATHVADHNY